MENKVDFVILYVNPNDAVWQRTAKKYDVFDLTTSMGHMRFQDDHTIELAVDSIRKFCDFAGDIYLVVSSKSQVPKSLKEKVKTITHSEFIPKKYLPTFSAVAIEVFLPLLPNVREQFIFMNDDMVFTNKIYYENFFKKGLPLANISIERETLHAFTFHKNSYNLIMGNKMQDGCSLHSQHGPTPFCKSLIKECYEEYKEELLKTVTPLRRTSINVNQYVYSFYLFCNYYVGNINLNHKTFHKIEDYQNFDWNNIDKYQSICVNTPSSGDITTYVEQLKNYIKN